MSAAAGISPQAWGTSAAFVAARSGYLDLIICNYAQFSPDSKQLCDAKDVKGNPIQTSCGPREYQPVHAILFRNQGEGRFTPVTLTATTGRGLGIAACDIDSSGKQVIAFANDEIAGDLLQAVGTDYTNVAAAAGVAYDGNGNIHGGMGADWGDQNNDGKPDLVVTTFQNEPKCLYQNSGDGVFSDVSFRAGIGAATTPFVAFGVKFIDFDNDGWLDLAIANGHVQDNIAEIDANTTYRQSSQLFHNQGRSAENTEVIFTDVSANRPRFPEENRRAWACDG